MSTNNPNIIPNILKRDEETMINLYPKTLFNELDEKEEDDYEQGLFGVASRTYMRGLILGTCDKFKRPVVILQKKTRNDSKPCKNCKGDDNNPFCYSRSYSRLESTLFYEHWAVLCKEIRNKEQKICCCEQDEIIADFVLKQKDNVETGYKEIKYNSHTIKAEIFKEPKGGTHICVKYECPISHQDELAINVNVEGIEGVIIIGQLLFKETTDDQINRFLDAVEKYCKGTEKEKLKNFANLKERKRSIKSTVKDAFECVRDLEKSLNKEYKFKLADNVRFLQEKMVKTFDETYKKVIPVVEKTCKDEVEKCNIKYEYLKSALGEALNIFSNAVEKKGIIKVNYLLPEGLYFESKYSSFARRDEHDKKDTIRDLIESNYRNFSNDGFTKLNDKYLVYRRKLDLHEEKYAYIVTKALIYDESINRLFDSFMQYVSLSITELYAQYNDAQITSYTKIMRHELGQLNEAVLIRINTFEEAVNSQNSNYYTYEFIQETRHAIEDFRSHSHSTMLRCNSSRYFTLLPPTQKEWFYPYESFLYKWKYIYEKIARNKLIDFVMAPVQLSDLSRPRMFADKSMIEQVAYNLTNNALKYSLPGTTITIDCKLNEKKDLYQIIVTSFGRSIKEDEKERLFEYGYRGSNQNEADGSGLGLYLSRKIAEQHKGTLELIIEKVSDYDVSCLHLYEDMPNKYIDSDTKESVLKEIVRLAKTDYCHEIKKPQFNNQSFTPYLIRKYLKSGTMKYNFILSIPYRKKEED